MAKGPYTPPTTCLESQSSSARSTPIISNHVAVHSVVWHADLTGTIVASTVQQIQTKTSPLGATIYDMAWGNKLDVIISVTQNSDFVIESSNDATNIFQEERRIALMPGVNWFNYIVLGRYCRMTFDNWTAASNTFRLGFKFRAV